MTAPMKPDLAFEVDHWRANGWAVEQVGEYHVIMVYDDGGRFARSLDRQRRSLGRASLMYMEDGTVESRLLSKMTTNVLHWIRYLQMKGRM